VRPWDGPASDELSSLTVCEIDSIFRTEGVELTTQACKKAIQEWGGSVNEITHTVAVTTTNSGVPGYNFLVARELGLPLTTDQTLLSGVGCAGGMSALRAAASIARGASAQGRPARILVMACELSTTSVWANLVEAERDPTGAKIGPALFGDGAAAFIICNGLVPEAKTKAVYSLVDCSNVAIPGTLQYMSQWVDPLGMNL
jgi:fungal type III polyketide synthase